MKNIKDWNKIMINTIPREIQIKHKKALKSILRMNRAKLFPYFKITFSGSNAEID
jgi:hypothetical protein